MPQAHATPERAGHHLGRNRKASYVTAKAHLLKERPEESSDERPLLTDREDDDPTDVAELQRAYNACVPCRATGRIGVLVATRPFERRLCIICHGIGHQRAEVPDALLVEGRAPYRGVAPRGSGPHP